MKRKRHEPFRLTVFDDCLTSSEALAYYEKYQVLHVRSSGREKSLDGLQVLQSLYQKHPSIIDQNFTLESTSTKKKMDSFEFADVSSLKDPLYISVLLQQKAEAVQAFLDHMPPSSSIPAFTSQWEDFSCTLPVWVFLATNIQKELVGRGEHTDDLKEMGTFHFQVVGKKKWSIRPVQSATSWTQKGTSFPADCDSLEVECCEGDYLFINTRLWWHATTIPECSHRSDSMSFARDFNYKSATAIATAARGVEVGDGEGEKNFTNRDGIYAAADIKEGCVVLRESEMPDCELSRSNEANCYVGEDEETGEGALVAKSDICAGDWLTVPFSSDEESEGGDEEEEEEGF